MTRYLRLLRGEMHCFACARYLGDFESHPDTHGKRDVHIVPRDDGDELPQHAVETEDGLRCSRCGGRVVLDYVESIPIALAA